MKYDQDKLYLIADFLEEQLDIVRDKSSWGLDKEDQDLLVEEEFMFEEALEVIKSLIKE